jgi:hypothetical protein
LTHATEAPRNRFHIALAGQLRHIGFEDDTTAGFARERDVNGVEWERFSLAEQDRRIMETYGAAIRATTSR